MKGIWRSVPVRWGSKKVTRLDNWLWQKMWGRH